MDQAIHCRRPYLSHLVSWSQLLVQGDLHNGPSLDFDLINMAKLIGPLSAMYPTHNTMDQIHTHLHGPWFICKDQAIHYHITVISLLSDWVRKLRWKGCRYGVRKWEGVIRSTSIPGMNIDYNPMHTYPNVSIITADFQIW
jgi:hypothetical protein